MCCDTLSIDSRDTLASADRLPLPGVLAYCLPTLDGSQLSACTDRFAASSSCQSFSCQSFSLVMSVARRQFFFLTANVGRSAMSSLESISTRAAMESRATSARDHLYFMNQNKGVLSRMSPVSCSSLSVIFAGRRSFSRSTRLSRRCGRWAWSRLRYLPSLWSSSMARNTSVKVDGLEILTWHDRCMASTCTAAPFV